MEPAIKKLKTLPKDLEDIVVKNVRDLEKAPFNTWLKHGGDVVLDEIIDFRRPLCSFYDNADVQVVGWHDFDCGKVVYDCCSCGDANCGEGINWDMLWSA
jgi:hypothetical protein